MVDNLKYGDIVLINGKYQMILNILKMDDIYEITIKDMESGREKKELLTDIFLSKLDIKKVSFEYIKQDENYYYFYDTVSNKELKYTLPFIGSDIEYINGNLIKEFKQQTKPVIINCCWDNIEEGTPIILSCDTKDAKIYYTTDGKDPDINSDIYTNPIIADKNFTLKAFSLKDGMKTVIYLHLM